MGTSYYFLYLGGINIQWYIAGWIVFFLGVTDSINRSGGSIDCFNCFFLRGGVWIEFFGKCYPTIHAPLEIIAPFYSTLRDGGSKNFCVHTVGMILSKEKIPTKMNWKNLLHGNKHPMARAYKTNDIKKCTDNVLCSWPPYFKCFSEIDTMCTFLHKHLILCIGQGIFARVWSIKENWNSV